MVSWPKGVEYVPSPSMTLFEPFPRGVGSFLPFCTFVKIFNCRLEKKQMLGVRSKKTEFFLTLSEMSDSPPHPPPFGTPFKKKKKNGLFCILGHKEHFWFSKKSLFGWYFYLQISDEGNPPIYWAVLNGKKS